MICERAERSREFAEITVRVSGLETFHGGAQRTRVHCGLREHLKLRTQRHDLRAVGWPSRRQDGKRLLARIGQARPGAHAEGIIDHQQQEFLAVHIRGRAIDEWIRERQREQQKQQRAQREAAANSAGGDA